MIHHTTRHDSSPHRCGATRPSWLATSMQRPMPAPLAPEATPRRSSGNSDVATPGAGTHTPAPPRPERIIPIASWGTDCAVASTTRATVVNVSPLAINRWPGTRIDRTITTIEPTR